MLVTEECLYEVTSVTRHRLWIEVLTGADKGMRMSIPLRSPEYDEPLQDEVQSLTEGQEITCRLESDTDPPDWRMKSIGGTDSSKNMGDESPRMDHTQSGGMSYELLLETPEHGEFILPVSEVAFDSDSVRLTGFPRPSDCPRELKDEFRFISHNQSALLLNPAKFEHIAVGIVETPPSTESNRETQS